MKSRILRVYIIFISIVLIIGINKAYAQAINPDSFYPDIINILPNELMIEETGSSGRLQVSSTAMRSRTVSQNETWVMNIKAIGQVGDISNVQIGIDPNTEAIEPPPLPPVFSVSVKILEGSNFYGILTKPPGSDQEVWVLSVIVGGPGSEADIDDPNSNFYPVLFWDPNQIGAAGVMDLRLGDANGTILLDMMTTNTYQTLEADAYEIFPSLNYAAIAYAVVFEPPTPPTWCRDGDFDGYGDPNDLVQSESQPSGYVADCGDCDDNDPNSYPGAPEICDGKDNDCDGFDPVDEIDNDGDLLSECEGDCDDSDPNSYPGALEICDGKDNVCDRLIDIKIIDPNNLDLEIEDLKSGLNKILIKNLCVSSISYSSYDFLLSFEGLLDIASLNSDERDVTGSFMSTYYFFGKICGKGFELSQDTSHPNLLYIY